MEFNPVELFCTVSTIALFANQFRSSWNISRDGGSINFPSFPFIFPPVNTLLWLRYGFLKHSHTIIFVNGVGLFLTSLALAVFMSSLKSGSERKRVSTSFLGAAVGVTAILWHIESLLMSDRKYDTLKDNNDHSLAESRLGVICAWASISMFGAPLVAIREVISLKSTEGKLDLSMCFMNLLVAASWGLYGFMQGDGNIIFPNTIGTLLGVIQIGLFFCFGPKRKRFKQSTKLRSVQIS